MNTKRIIGISGVARAGKDTFAAILEAKLQLNGKKVLKYALASPLKGACEKFLSEHFGMNVYTQVTSEKDTIRPFLVWYGDTKRKATEGRYFIDIATNTINVSDCDYVIVTDIRYDKYDRDELHWLQKECGGVLCHVSRYHLDSGQRQFVMPPNSHERENDPKIKAKADFVVEWKSVEVSSPEELLVDASLNAHVDAFMEKFSIG